MGSFFQNKANVITAVLIFVVLLGGGYFLIQSRQGGTTAPSFVSVDTQSLPIGFGAVTSTNNAPISSDLISVLSGLRTITLEGSLFKDPSFLSLQDFGIPLQEEPIGRYNPFLPIGVDAVDMTASVSSVSSGSSVKDVVPSGFVKPGAVIH
ncbi:MAG: hypothetical protein RLZZ347_343 [Candidatus Parcubacteria bacterium]|jgi:hypothetical protein